MTYRARHLRIPPAATAPGRRPAESRPAESRPAESRPAEPRPAEPGPAESGAESSRGRRGTLLLIIATVAFALALARFALHLAEPSFLARMFDLGIYRDGGLIVRHAYHFRSGQPTPLYDWVSPGGGNPFTYPPFAAGIFAVLSFLAPAALQWGMTALSFGALIVAVWLTMDSSGVPKSRIRTAAVVAVSAVALWTQPVQSNFGLGQINLLLMAAIIWDLRPAGARGGLAGPAGQADRPGRWWTGAATGIAAGIKLTPLIVIPYLLVTRRFRQAAVAAGAFAATVGIGFAVMPGASMAYWWSGLFDRANGTPRANLEFFFASAWNQSLRGFLSRIMQHAQLAAGPWLIAALLTAAVGVLCATWLHNDGFPMLGLLTCALTGLLISPISWLHHWVWVAPWLAALTAMAIRSRGAARRSWACLAVLIALVFAEGPALASITGSQRELNVVTDVPMKQPLAWHGLELLAGNVYVLAGAAGLLALFGWGVARAFQPGRLMTAVPDAALEPVGVRSGQTVPGGETGP
ncbi:MAG TPA: glycosyltransferase 87 family protein [Streptosporangiaceae bacterium]|nr:glycosyltransferase 87 family protein [Streptosporangiaceae bacterium]